MSIIVNVWLHAFVNLALADAEWLTECSNCFILWDRAPQYLLDRRLGGFQSQSGQSGKEKKL
jgi:hypothetical protein